MPKTNIAPPSDHTHTLRALLWIGVPLLLMIGGTATHSIRLQSSSPPSYDLKPIHRWQAASPASEFRAEPEQFKESNDGIQECTITLLSGRKITGELIRQSSLVVVVGINGIETTFQRKRIASVVILPPVSRRFADMRAAIPDSDIDARLALVEWLRERKAYTLAIDELESILLITPNNPRAKLLYRWLTEYSKLTPSNRHEKKTNTKDGNKDGNSSGTNSTKPKRSMPPQRNQITPLTAEQINLIRVYEIDLDDPPKLIVPDETIRALMLQHPDAFSPNEDERKAIFDLSQIDRLRLLFTHKARNLYSQVQILEDPKSMALFRTKVHSQRGWIINTCATTRCHGGVNAGDFQLINTRPNAVETVYTNFAIIEDYTLANGASLINYDDPERSPLLQMAMIKKNALTPHPEIPRDFRGARFRPIFRSTRDRKYRDAIEWIQSMYQPRPVYGFPLHSQPKPKPSNAPPGSTPDQSGP